MSQHLSTGLQERNERIQSALNYVQETKRLFDQYGSQELAYIKTEFDSLEKSLNSSGEVKLVVIGEFSRGKSCLVNALLDICLLRSANEATTAINTFLRKLPVGIDQRFIRIHFQDGRPANEIVWQEGDTNTLEKWSTELDSTNASARKEIDYIEIFTSHPLLDQGLVLIDTPGLQSFVTHHEAITKRAIAESHIAIWVQSVDQLGGNATEWAFLSDTIRKNFNKFITVVNMWDKVLEPQDPYDQEKPEAERVQAKLQKVRNGFEVNLSDISAAELAKMTNEDHLMGVSAFWGLSKDEDKKKRSGVDKLAKRISEMLTSGEALEQIYLKPLKSIHTIQHNLVHSIEDELKQLSSDQSLAERNRESETLDLEIKSLKADLDSTNRNAKGEHDRTATALIAELQDSIISPLEELKADIDNQVTESYVKRNIEQGIKELKLPPTLQHQFEQVTASVNDKMRDQGIHVEKLLADLRADYASDMEKHTQDLKKSIQNINFELPALDLSFEIDFSEVNAYQAEKSALEQDIQEKRQQLESLEVEVANNAENIAAVEAAKQKLIRAERARDSLGSRPAPHQHTETENRPRWGIFGWIGMTKDVAVTKLDDSNVKAWLQDSQEITAKIESQETALERIQQEEMAKSGKRLTAQRVQQKYQQEVAKIERQQQQLESASNQKQSELVKETYHRLIQSTAGTLSKFSKQLQQQVKPHIEEIFNAQLNLLKQQVEQQIAQPLNAKLAQRQQVQLLIEQGKEQIELRKNKIKQGLTELSSLITATSDALNDAA